MDARNDDSSAGSDSLDKSLQRKCVVDDMGQGEGKQQENCLVTADIVTTSVVDNLTEQQQQQCTIENNTINNTNATHQLYKTEKIVGDGGVAIAIEQSQQTKQQDVATRKCDLNERKTDDDRVSSALNSSSCSNNSNNNHNNNSNNKNNNNSNSNAFETKVTQISKNLKETTLAEYEVGTRSSSTSSSSSDAEALLDGGAASELLDQNSQLSINSESVDEQDGRSKKVRFHPDVKENDGGNRVIPKKKKKLKNNTNGEDDGTLTSAAGGSTQRTTGTDDEMDYEEEEDATEEEEEFNLAKTIAEAQNYLKLHPLTFVGSALDKSASNISGEGKCLQNGLMEEEDLPQLSESSEDEDFYEEMQPECGVERILGKQIKNGKAELLVRFVHTPDLCWESEERISAMCPNMINKYELNRERRQERLMRHVAKRQNIRQRYTDF